MLNFYFSPYGLQSLVLGSQFELNTVEENVQQPCSEATNTVRRSGISPSTTVESGFQDYEDFENQSPKTPKNNDLNNNNSNDCSNNNSTAIVSTEENSNKNNEKSDELVVQNSN